MNNNDHLTAALCAMRVLGSVVLLAACTPGPDVSLPASTAIIEATAPPLTSVSTADSPTHMRELIENGVANGQVEQGGEQLLQTCARVQQALGTPARQNTNAAKQQLVLMQFQIVQGIGSKTVDPAFGQAVLSSIDSVARDYDLQLPQTFTR